MTTPTPDRLTEALDAIPRPPNREREAYDAGRLVGYEEGIEAALLAPVTGETPGGLSTTTPSYQGGVVVDNDRLHRIEAAARELLDAANVLVGELEDIENRGGPATPGWSWRRAG